MKITEHAMYDEIEIIIDPKFRAILPKLDDRAFSDLEASLLKYGCQFPIVLWNNILIDGYHRYSIIKKHTLPFNAMHLDFDSREDVIIWIIDLQIAHRNLTPIQLSYFRGLHYNMEKVRIGSVNQYTKVASGQSDHQQNSPSASQRLSEHYNVSPKTIRRDAQLADAINIIGEKSPETKEKILAGQGNISRVQLRELASGSPELITKTIDKIIDGTHTPRRTRDETDKQPRETVENFTPPSYEQLTLDGFITKTTQDIDIGLKRLTDGDSAQSKIAIRQLIEQLEALYRGL